MLGPDSEACLGDIDDERDRLIQASGAVELDPSTARRYLRALPRERFASHAYRGRGERPHIQPRGGFPDLARQRALTLALSEAGADFMPLTIDSHTRHNDYAGAARLLAAGLAQGHDLLNGYPLISHGVARTRELFADIAAPVSLRHGTPDARLLAEYALAAGITEIEGGALSYTLPYAKAFPLDRALVHWQYVDRLCALAGPADAPIHRESFGPLTATLVPPVITIAVQLCELLLAAEQGVRSFAVSFGQTGSFEQDIAVAQVLREQSASLLARFGFTGVEVRLVFHQWMGAFPAEPSLAWQLIAVSAAVSRLVGADKVVIKTPDEATGIPSIDSNVAAVQAVRYVLEMFAGSSPVTNEVIEDERTLISSEVSDVMAQVLDRPAGSLLSAVHQSVLAGTIDVPFAPHERNAGQLLTDRGPGRRIRILAPGAVPLSPADLARERELLGARSAGDGQLWQRLLRDVRILA
ncbi:MAG: methylaspartate mutase [Jatrophihabitans sp.]